MGYTHIWRRPETFERAGFLKASQEISQLIARFISMGIKLSGPTGEGLPEVNDSLIAFNGARECGHRYRDLGKPFPSETAEGVLVSDPPYNPEVDPWVSGPYLNTRACGGSCVSGSFLVDRRYLIRDWERPDHDGFYFCYTETNYKPYDLAVTAALVRLKEHLGQQILISSDGGERAFDDAKRFCRELYGWSARFELEPQVSELA